MAEAVATSADGFLEVVARPVEPAMREARVVLWVGELVSIELSGYPSPEFPNQWTRGHAQGP